MESPPRIGAVGALSYSVGALASIVNRRNRFIICTSACTMGEAKRESMPPRPVTAAPNAVPRALPVPRTESDWPKP